MRENASFPRFYCFQARSCSADQNGLKRMTRKDLGPQGAQDLHFFSVHYEQDTLQGTGSLEVMQLSQAAQ